MNWTRSGIDSDVKMIRKGELAYFEIITETSRHTHYRPDMNDISAMCNEAGIDFFRVKELIENLHKDVIAIVIDKEKFNAAGE